MSLGKRRHAASFPPASRKRKTAPAIDEITFNISAREEYLSGFHKRKLQRTKHAKEEAAKRNREEKLTARRLLREGRKADLDKHVEAMNTMMRGELSDAAESRLEDSSVEGEQWEGILEKPAIDHEDEYIDEDKLTTVTVETVEVSRDGLHKVYDEDNIIDHKAGTASHIELKKENHNRKRIWTREFPAHLKQKKKKFRYESKAERKVTRQKERSGSKTKANARRS